MLFLSFKTNVRKLVYFNYAEYFSGWAADSGWLQMVVYSGLLQTTTDGNSMGKRRQTAADGSRQRQTVVYSQKHLYVFFSLNSGLAFCRGLHI